MNQEMFAYISVTIVILTSIWVGVDSHRFQISTSKKPYSWKNSWLFLCLLLWIVAFPAYLFKRAKTLKERGIQSSRSTITSSLGAVAVIVVLLCIAAPFVVRPGLPTCTSQQVVQLIERAIRGTPLGAKAKSIDGHREVGYDRTADRRQGQCVVHTDGGNVVVNYLVEWQDRNKGLFQLRIPPADLPSCTSQEVVQLIEQTVRGMPLGAKAKSIDGHREVGYDRAADRRQGQCVAHTDGGDVIVNYVMQWRDRDKGLFEVRIMQ